MASGEAAPAPAAVQTFLLRVSIHCQGCKKKVSKVLKSIEGVHNVTVDRAQQKVTVTGTVDADTLVRRLYKSGKQAVPWHPPTAEAKKPEAAVAAPEALPAPPAGDGGKDDDAADKKSEQEAGSEKKPEAEKETELVKKAEKEEAKPSDEAKKDGSESEEAAAVTAKETGNDEDEANKKKNKPKDAGEAEPAAAAVERSLSPAPKHAHEEYYPYYAQQPMLSYHMAQPRASVSYYAPRPEQAYSVQQPPPQPAYSVQQPHQQPMQQWSPSYLYMPYPQAAPESYYHDYYSPPETHSSPPLQDSYRIFDDENPNSCSVM